MLLASLWWLGEHADGRPTQRQLAEQAGTDPMMTSQVIRRLEARGLVVREADPSDSRARKLWLSARGGELLGGALSDVERADDAYFAALGADRTAFLSGLAVLVDQ